MASNILIEGCNLTLAEGTGIATYARNLNRAVRATGRATDVLIDINKPVYKTDPVLNEILAFDALSADPPQIPLLRRQARWIRGAWFGTIDTAKVPLSGVVAASMGGLNDFDGAYVATNLDLLARRYFGRFGRRAWVKVEKPPALFHATQAIAVGVKGCPNVYTIHDLVPLRLPSTTLDNKKYFLDMMRHLCRTADHIVTVSEYSRRDIIKFFGISEERITNTYQTVQLPAKALACSIDAVAAELESLGLTYQQYFLFVGAIEPKKNLPRLIDAYATARSEYPLVIVGGQGWQNETIVKKIKDEQFLSYRIIGDKVVPARQVRQLAYAPAELLPALIRGARALLFPSLYEGFGLPVLEAMVLGTPVIAANATSLPEVAGDAAILVNPLDIDGIAAAIRRLDSDGDLRQELSIRGRQRAEYFSPENYRKRVAKLYDRILSGDTHSAAGR